MTAPTRARSRRFWSPARAARKRAARLSRRLEVHTSVWTSLSFVLQELTTPGGAGPTVRCQSGGREQSGASPMKKFVFAAVFTLGIVSVALADEIAVVIQKVENKDGKTTITYVKGGGGGA